MLCELDDFILDHRAAIRLAWVGQRLRLLMRSLYEPDATPDVNQPVKLSDLQPLDCILRLVPNYRFKFDRVHFDPDF